MNSDKQRIEAALGAGRLEIETAILAGQASCVGKVFESFPEILQHEEAAVELIYLDYVLREEAGLQPLAENYLESHPAYAHRLERLFDFDSLLQSGFPELSAALDTEDDTDNDGTVTVAGEIPRATFAPMCTIGDYDCLEVIGRGGMGLVYRAVHRTLQRPAAVKIISIFERNDAKAVSRLLSEARICSLLNHPNIVQVFDSGLHEDSPYYAMEFVPGGTLASVLADGPLSPTVSAKVIHVLARTMAFAHGQSIIHRDIKPGNVLLAPVVGDTGLTLRSNSSPVRIKIADFGLAIFGQDPTLQTQSPVGTPSYMSPEQIRGSGDVDERSDLYSLGALMFHLLVGKPPFQAATSIETMNLVLSEEPVPIRQQLPSVPRDLETICLKCLQKEKDKRYASANELADDLERFLEHRPIRARPVSWLGHSQRWAKRNPLSALLLFLVVVTACSTTALWLRADAFRRDAERANRVSQAANQQTLATLRKLTEDVVMDKFAMQDELSDGDRDYLQQIAEAYAKLANITESDAISLRIRGEGHYWSGVVYMRLAEQAVAVEHFESATELLLRAEALTPSEELFVLVNKSLEFLVELFEESSLLDQAIESTQVRIDRCKNPPLTLTAVTAKECQRSLVAGYRQLGRQYELNGFPDKAMANWQEALRLGELALEKAPGDISLLNALVGTLRSLGTVVVDAEQQSTYCEQAVTLGRELLEQNPDQCECKLGVTWALYDLAMIYRNDQQFPLALAAIEEAVELSESLSKEMPLVDEYQSLHAIMLGRRGELLLVDEHFVDAEPDFRRSLELLQKPLEHSPESFNLHITNARGRLGIMRCTIGKGSTPEQIDAAYNDALQAILELRSKVESAGADMKILREFENALERWAPSSAGVYPKEQAAG